MVTFGGQPAYLQVADKLADRIRTGQIAPGDRLPSLMDLTREFQVSKIVATMAVRHLHTLGLIYSHRGKGTFVRERATMRRRSTIWYSQRGAGSPTARNIEAAGSVASWEHHSEPAVAGPEIAARLAVDEGAPVMVTTYTFRSDGVPIQLSTSWEPLSVTGGTRIELPEQSTDEDGAAVVGVVDRFDSIGVGIDTVDEVVGARLPLPAEVVALAMPEGTPVITIERTYAVEGSPVETADIVMPADRYQLHYGLSVT